MIEAVRVSPPMLGQCSRLESLHLPRMLLRQGPAQCRCLVPQPVQLRVRPSHIRSLGCVHANLRSGQQAPSHCRAGDGGAANTAKPLTGEEDESTVWSGKAALYRFEKRSDRSSWRERGIGVLRINVGPSGRARLVMRQVGNLKLLLNASLFPELKLERTEGLPRVSFCCPNQAGDAGADAEHEGQGTQEKDASDTQPPGVVAALAAGTSRSGGGIGMYALKMGSMEKMDAFVQNVNRLKAAEGSKNRQSDAGKGNVPDDPEAANNPVSAEGRADVQGQAGRVDEQDAGKVEAAEAAAACALDLAS
jgi:RanBP1 domain